MKISASKLRKTIAGCLDDIYFNYNGKKAGVTSEIHDFKPTFQAWYGNEIKYYDNVDDVMCDRFYDGKSLNDLTKIIQIYID